MIAQGQPGRYTAHHRGSIDMQGKLEFALWALAMLTFPFYIFGKGNVQISSMILVLLFVALLARQSRGVRLPLPPGGSRPLGLVAAFVSYSLIVTLVWAVILSHTGSLIIPAFYAFDLLVFGSVLVMYALHGVRFLKWTRWVLLTSVFLQFVLSFFFANYGFRERLFFANANQLGYYGLVCASIFALPLPGERGWRQSVFMIGILMCMWLALLSLSKAAMISTAIFLVLSASRRPLQLIVGSLVVTALVLGGHDVVEHRIDNLQARVASFGQAGGGSDDNLEGRGYDRIWENPQMLVLGAAEGANDRWDSFSKTGEIHSTFGTIAFSYGIPGLLIMGAFFFSLLRPAALVMLPFLLPELIFSLTHMSLRFVMTWTYFAMLFCVGLEVRKELVARGGIRAVLARQTHLRHGVSR